MPHPISFLSLFFIFSCSENKSVDIEIPLISEVEKLVNHSKEFERKVTTYETPGGKIHFAIGYGIANSIMVEGIDLVQSITSSEVCIYRIELTLHKSRCFTPWTVWKVSERGFD